jgi:hypothetical protein
MKLIFCSAARGAEVGTVNGCRTLFLLVIMVTVTVICTADKQQHFSRQWAVHIEGGVQVADSIASKHGFVNVGEVSLQLDLRFLSNHQPYSHKSGMIAK